MPQPLDDRKAETGATVTAVIGRARLEIRLADAGQVLVTDADAVVLDRKQDARRFGASADRHLAAAIGEADRIGQEVEQNLVQRALVGDYFRQPLGCQFFELNTRLTRP